MKQTHDGKVVSLNQSTNWSYMGGELELLPHVMRRCPTERHFTQLFQQSGTLSDARKEGACSAKALWTNKAFKNMFCSAIN